MVKRKHRTYFIFGFSALLFLHSCVEPFNEGTLHFEKALVIEATITNELKFQEIKLSKTYRLEDDKKPYEINAQVMVVDDANNTYNFQEIDSGTYRSTVKFQAEVNRNYQLNITRKSGSTYTSTKQKMTSVKGLDSIYAVRSVDNIGNEGISIYADSYDPSGNSKYYRYEFQETKKIILPFWSNLRLVVISDVYPYDVQTRGKSSADQDRVCYQIKNSSKILQTSTVGLSQDKIDKFLVKFVPADDYFLIYGYSILVKQYVQSAEAYSYYKVLSKFSVSGNAFSQTQSGRIVGNIFPVDNSEEKVIGFFDVSSVSSKRIFFKHKDFYPTNFSPRYKLDCSTIAPAIAEGHQPEGISPLVNAIKQGDYMYFGINPNYAITIRDGPYLMVPRICGDCRTRGTNIKPSYWID